MTDIANSELHEMVPAEEEDTTIKVNIEAAGRSINTTIDTKGMMKEQVIAEITGLLDRLLDA